MKIYLDLDAARIFWLVLDGYSHLSIVVANLAWLRQSFIALDGSVQCCMVLVCSIR